MKIIKVVLIVLVVLYIDAIAMALPRDISVILIPSEVQYQFIDSSGNITGYDPITKSIKNNIPNSFYYLSIMDKGEDTTPLAKDEKYYRISPTRIADDSIFNPGNYKVKIFGSTLPETIQFEFHVYYHGYKGPQEMAEILNTLIYPNVTWTYEFNIPVNPTTTGDILLIKVANPQDLIIDINAAASLGYIGNPKFVSELVKEINDIEAEKAKGKVDDGLTPAQKAKKEYTELLKEITEKYNKPESDEFVKQEAYTVLKEDLEYIISHL